MRQASATLPVCAGEELEGMHTLEEGETKTLEFPEVDEHAGKEDIS